jgi:hypothetical protein
VGRVLERERHRVGQTARPLPLTKHWHQPPYQPPPQNLPNQPQAFVGLNLRHLLVVDAANRVAGIVTRKDLDHAAGHGWWRMSAQAPKPIQDAGNGGGGGGGGGAGRLGGLNGFIDGFMKIPSYGFLRSLVNPNGNNGNGNGNGGGGLVPPPAAATAAGGALPQKPPPFGAKSGGGAGGGGGDGAGGGNGGTPRSAGGLLGVGRDPNAFAGGSPARRDGRSGGGGYSSGGEEGESLLGGGGGGGGGAVRGGRGTGGGAGRLPAAL